MDEFKNLKNRNILNAGCINMLIEKYNISLSDNVLNSILDKIISDICNEYSENNLKLNELNNIVLFKIKKYYEEEYKSPVNNTNVNNNNTNNNTKTIKVIKEDTELLSDDLISVKLMELENKRNNMTCDINNINNDLFSEKKEESYIPAPIQTVDINNVISSIVNNKKNNETTIIYKNYIINSINRDWLHNPSRNNIKFNISIDIKKHIFYPECICFPAFVKNITPYVLMMISDGIKKIYYTFVCIDNNNNGWNVWKPLNNVENIILNTDKWIIKFFDFTNADLELGSDDIIVSEVKYNNNFIDMITENSIYLINNNFKVNDKIFIKSSNGKSIVKVIEGITDIGNNRFSISIDNSKGQIRLEDFYDCKILNANNQYTFIVKYNYNYKL
jgi:hypothetical protein